jgi:hypothetical protein
MGRMRGIIEEPTGLRYIPSLLSPDRSRWAYLMAVLAIALGVCCMMVAYFYFIGPSD